jgi:heme A synthase
VTEEVVTVEAKVEDAPCLDQRKPTKVLGWSASLFFLAYSVIVITLGLLVGALYVGVACLIGKPLMWCVDFIRGKK